MWDFEITTDQGITRFTGTIMQLVGQLKELAWTLEVNPTATVRCAGELVCTATAGLVYGKVSVRWRREEWKQRYVAAHYEVYGEDPYEIAN